MLCLFRRIFLIIREKSWLLLSLDYIEPGLLQFFLSRALFFSSNAMISIYNSCKRLHLSINRFSDVSIVSMTKNEYCLAVQFL